MIRGHHFVVLGRVVPTEKPLILAPLAALPGKMQPILTTKVLGLGKGPAGVDRLVQWIGSGRLVGSLEADGEAKRLLRLRRLRNEIRPECPVGARGMRILLRIGRHRFVPRGLVMRLSRPRPPSVKVTRGQRPFPFRFRRDHQPYLTRHGGQVARLLEQDRIGIGPV